MLFSGHTFALSASGVSQAALEQTIVQNGGKMSRTIHKRVHFLVATPVAVQRSTQAVRKVQRKFTEVAMVTPEFVQASIEAGVLLLDKLESFRPATSSERSLPPTAAPEVAGVAAASSGPRGASLQDIGLRSGERIEVLVEMCDAIEPLMQWWPSCVSAPEDGSGSVHPIVYEPLPARGYDEETPSRARFKDAPAPPEFGGDGRLYDLDEGVWRPWRRIAHDGLRAGDTIAQGEEADSEKRDADYEAPGIGGRPAAHGALDIAKGMPTQQRSVTSGRAIDKAARRTANRRRKERRKMGSDMGSDRAYT